MSRKSWVKVPISILDNPKIARLPDAEWIAYINGLPRHYDVSPVRYEWLRVRKGKVKEVFERDKPVCANCGTTERLEIDHIIPLSKGGSNELDNLQILCRKCNSKKRDN